MGIQASWCPCRLIQSRIDHSLRKPDFSTVTFLIITINRLSAYLYNITANSTYLSTAEQSAVFIREQLYNNGIIMDTFYAQTSAIDNGTGPFTYNSGFAIEGLAVLGQVPGMENWRTLCVFLECIISPTS